jgi:hypothetical protein
MIGAQPRATTDVPLPISLTFRISKIPGSMDAGSHLGYPAPPGHARAAPLSHSRQIKNGPLRENPPCCQLGIAVQPTLHNQIIATKMGTFWPITNFCKKTRGRPHESFGRTSQACHRMRSDGKLSAEQGKQRCLEYYRRTIPSLRTMVRHQTFHGGSPQAA